MLKGLALTPPVIGRVSIGHMVEKNGKRLPVKDDEFTITSQVQGRDGWINHPLDEALRAEPAAKLRAIPVRLLFDDPDLNLRANYTLFDRGTGRPLCVGDGQTCRRVTSSGVQTMDCPTPGACDVAQAGGCKPYGRLHVRIDTQEGTSGSDELGSFIFRTTGVNSIHTLATRMHYLRAATGGLLSALPLALRLRGKSTVQSHRAPIYYVDLTLRDGTTMLDAVAQAQEVQRARAASGFDQVALEQAAHEGYRAGAFEESEEDGSAVVEEFFTQGAGVPEGHDEAVEVNAVQASLRRKLHSKAAEAHGR